MGPALLTAAEVSGDAVAAPVLRALQRRAPQYSWQGFGGSQMTACEGFEALGDVRDLSGAGVAELIPRLPTLLRARHRIQQAIDADPPVAIFVDAPDLHLPLARRATARGVRTVQLVVPQFWAWRPKRKELLARDARLSLCLFPFEVAPIRALGGAAHWVGHPLVDTLPSPATFHEPEGALRIALLPGSRPNEVHRNLPLAVDTLRRISGQTPVEIVVPWRLGSRPPALPNVTFVHDRGAEVLATAQLAVVAFGTATLEAALLGIPTVTFGSAHRLTALLVRRHLRNRWFALPNILLGHQAVDEHVLPDGSEGLERSLGRLLADLGGARQAALETSASLRSSLGSGGFAERAAGCIEALL